MTSNFWPDWTTAVTVATSSVDATLTVPESLATDAINNPNSTGSFYYLSIAGAPVTMTSGGTATFGSTTMAVLESGAHLTHPLFFQPGAVLHFITEGGTTGYASLIRARRAS